MIAELGHFALTLAFAVALFQVTVPLLGAARGWADWMRAAAPAALMQFLLTGLAFAALIHAFVTSDFSLRVVAANSHSLKPMIFKVSGTWGNHEGSMLLWVLILTIFGAMVAAFGRNLPLGLKARALSVQAMIAAAFFAFILFTSNPFDRLDPAPLDGNDLNPLLQDIGLALHPPFLYLGYVGLSMAFSFAVAALIEGRVDAAWARWVRPWTLAAWIALTSASRWGASGPTTSSAGAASGSGTRWRTPRFCPGWWAPRCLHSAIVVEKRERAEDLDHPAGDHRLLDEPDRHLPGALGRTDLGACLRQRPGARRLHPGTPGRSTIAGSLTLFAWRAPRCARTGLFARSAARAG